MLARDRESDRRALELRQLKHIVRYLAGKPRVALAFGDGGQQPMITVLADTDYAGCVETRRSTNGGVIFDGMNPLTAWSTTQTTPAMSSAEAAELYSCVKGAAEGLGAVAGYGDMGEQRVLLRRSGSYDVLVLAN